jgi:hypothetical protein
MSIAAAVAPPWTSMFFNEKYLLEDETIETTMDVDVDELWTRTVANKPSINSAIGFERMAPSEKI